MVRRHAASRGKVPATAGTVHPTSAGKKEEYDKEKNGQEKEYSKEPRFVGRPHS